MNLSSNIIRVFIATAFSFSAMAFKNKFARFIIAIAFSFSVVAALAQTRSFSSESDEIKYLNTQLSLAKQASDSGNFSQSISILKAAVAVDSTRDLLWFRLAESYRLSGDYANAIAAYQRAIALKPTEAAFHNNLADAYSKAQRIDDALSEYAIAAQVDSQGAAIYVFNMGAVLANKRRAEEAVSAFNLVIELDPSKADAYYWKGINLLGLSTVGSNRVMISPRGTRAALEKYLALSPVGNYAESAKKVLGSVGIESDSSVQYESAFIEAFRLAQPFDAHQEYKAGMDAEIGELARHGVSTAWAQKSSSFWSDPIVASALQQQLARERQTQAGLSPRYNASGEPSAAWSGISAKPVPSTTQEPAQDSTHAYDDQLKNAMALWKNSQVSEASKAVAALIQLNPTRWEGYGLAGAIEKAQNKLPEAKAAYQKALGVAPDGVKPQITQAIQQIETEQQTP